MQFKVSLQAPGRLEYNVILQYDQYAGADTCTIGSSESDKDESIGRTNA